MRKWFAAHFNNFRHSDYTTHCQPASEKTVTVTLLTDRYLVFFVFDMHGEIHCFDICFMVCFSESMFRRRLWNGAKSRLNRNWTTPNTPWIVTRWRWWSIVSNVVPILHTSFSIRIFPISYWDSISRTFFNCFGWSNFNWLWMVLAWPRKNTVINSFLGWVMLFSQK